MRAPQRVTGASENDIKGRQRRRQSRRVFRGWHKGAVRAKLNGSAPLEHRGDNGHDIRRADEQHLINEVMSAPPVITAMGDRRLSQQRHLRA